jgi:hypothetical protein
MTLKLLFCHTPSMEVSARGPLASSPPSPSVCVVCVACDSVRACTLCMQVFVCVHVCVHVCVCVRVRVCVCINNAQACVCMHAHMFMYVSMRLYAQFLYFTFISRFCRFQKKREQKEPARLQLQPCERPQNHSQLVWCEHSFGS